MFTLVKKYLIRQWLVLSLGLMFVFKSLSWLYSPFIDLPLFVAWSKKARDFPLNQFYTGGYEGGPRDWAYRIENSDRLPLDVWLFKAWGFILSLFPGENSETITEFTILVTVLLLEVSFFFACWFTLRQLRPGRENNALWSMLFLLLPSSLVVSNMMLTLEFLPATLTVLALGVLCKNTWWSPWLAGALSAAAILERPHFLVVIVAIGLYWLTLKPSAIKVGSFVGGGLISSTILCTPLGIGLFWDGGNGSVIDLLIYNLTFYDTYIWSGATIWSFMPNPVLSRYADFSFLSMGALGWFYSFTALVIASALIFMRKNLSNPYAIFTLSALLGQCLFFFAPRMLERYNFIVIICLFLALIFWRSKVGVTLILSLSFISALNSALAVAHQVNILPLELAVDGYRVLALANFLCLILFYYSLKGFKDKTNSPRSKQIVASDF